MSAGQKTSEQDQQHKAEIIDALNRVFAEFELVYHNQFIKAFPNDEKLQLAKQLWFNHLKAYSGQQILAAAHTAIKSSEFLPTIRGILKFCENDFDLYGLPEPRAAYIEACNAPSPKNNFAWSHPAVFYAGAACNWFFLANNNENTALPVFTKHYEKLCQQVRQGIKLEQPQPKALEEKSEEALSNEVQQEKIKQLKAKL